MSLIKKDFVENILCCPACRGDVSESSGYLICVGCNARYPIEDGIPIMINNLKMDASRTISFDKWNLHYEQLDLDSHLSNYSKLFERDTNSLLSKAQSRLSGSDCKVLEIGCGPASSRGFWHDKGYTYIGIDFSFNILKTAINLRKYNNGESLFVCGDILNPPFKHNVFDVVWGAGVIEHFSDTLAALIIMRDIIKQGGFILATFPYLSLGALTYRQVWGNIPDVAFLREISKFIHIGMLNKRLMRFGFEYSFTEGKIRKLVNAANLELVDFDHFEILTTFDYFKNEKIKAVLRKMEKNRLFWAMAYLLAEKK